MNRELAQIVLITASRARSALGELIPLITTHEDNESDEPAKLAISSAIYEIGLIENLVFEKYPEIKVEFDNRRAKYGRSFY